MWSYSLIICACLITITSSSECEKSNILRKIPVGHNISQQCQSEAEKLVGLNIEYQLCALLQARPFQVCTTCQNEYGKITTEFDNFINSTSADMAKCRDEFLAGDTVSVFDHVFNPIWKLWSDAKCDECLTLTIDKDGRHVYEKNADTKHILGLFTDFNQCRNNVSDKNASEVCVVCREAFDRLDTAYDEIILTHKQGMCMDVVDAINQTRVFWGDEKCTVRRRSGLDVYLTAGGIGIATIIFYLSSYYCSRVHGNVLLGERRLGSVLLASAFESEHRRRFFAASRTAEPCFVCDTPDGGTTEGGALPASRSCPRDLLTTNLG